MALSNMVLAQNIAVFSPEKALFGTQAAQQLGQQLSQQLKPQSERLDAVAQELQELQKRYQEDQALLSSEEIQQLELQINQGTQEFQKLNQYLNNAKLQTEQEFLALMRPKLNAILSTYIETNNIALIVNNTAVVYVQDGIDITAAITALLDQE
jgi:outer membrane protein